MNQENNEPKEPISVIYADARQTITSAMRNVLRAYPLPFFMVEGIFSEILLDLGMKAKMELSHDIEEYKQSMQEYYEKREKEMIEAFDKEREEMIRTFEETDGKRCVAEVNPESAEEVD